LALSHPLHICWPGAGFVCRFFASDPTLNDCPFVPSWLCLEIWSFNKKKKKGKRKRQSWRPSLLSLLSLTLHFILFKIDTLLFAENEASLFQRETWREKLISFVSLTISLSKKLCFPLFLYLCLLHCLVLLQESLISLPCIKAFVSLD
jgi:hypothetical protein